MKYLKLITTAIALILSSTLNAAVISIDWQSAGDNLITRDTTTGIDWLDLTATTPYMSYNSVFAELGPGGQFSGWRYATTDEVTSLLLTNFGIDLYAGNTSTGPLPAGLAEATSYLGNTTSAIGDQYTGLSGITSQGRLLFDGHLVVGASYDSDFSTFYRRIDPNLNTYFQSDASVAISVGHWLVADTPWEPAAVVPVPAAVWLFGSGLIGLIGVARRKTHV